MFFFFKQKTAYEMRISDWSSDVCSSDLGGTAHPEGPPTPHATLKGHKRGIGVYKPHSGDPRQAGSGLGRAEPGRTPWLRELCRGSPASPTGGLANSVPVPFVARRRVGCAPTPDPAAHGKALEIPHESPPL